MWLHGLVVVLGTASSGSCAPPSPQIIHGADILEVMHDYPELSQFVHSLYYCRYNEFFRSLSECGPGVLQLSCSNCPLPPSLPPSLPLGRPQCGLKRSSDVTATWRRTCVTLCVRCASKRTRSCLSPTALSLSATWPRALESVWSSLTGESHAHSTLHESQSGSTLDDYSSRELSRFIASGRLHCRIDKVGGVVETNRPDSKNFLYQVRTRRWTSLCCVESLSHLSPSS